MKATLRDIAGVRFGTTTFTGAGGAPVPYTQPHGLKIKPSCWVASPDWGVGGDGAGITTAKAADATNLYLILWTSGAGFTSGVAYSFRWVAIA